MMKKNIFLILCVLGASPVDASAKKTSYYAHLNRYIAEVKSSRTYGYVSEKTFQIGGWLKKGFFSKNNILLRDQMMAPVIIIGVVMYAAVQEIRKSDEAQKKRKERLKKVLAKNPKIA